MPGIAYKLCRVKTSAPGKIFPLFVLANEELPIGVWLEAKCGERNNIGKVKSRLGPLAFRPGFHLSDIPLAIHIGKKVDGVIKYMHDDNVWCECEYDDTINYQDEADGNGMINGKFNPQRAFLKHIPEDGYYRFKTNPTMLGTWIITGRIKILRILTDEEVAEICRRNGYEPMGREG